MTINDPIPADALLIDLRDEEDYRRGHLPGAVNLPPEAVSADPDRLILLYCYHGIRSFRAAVMLKTRGCRNARSLGGIDQYKGTLEK